MQRHVLVLGMLAWLMTPACQAQVSRERGFLDQAPMLIKHFKANGYKNVGVLKFLVARNGKGFSDNVGAMNLQVARRLEMALIFKNDPRNPVGIIADASAVARTINGAGHLSKEGRVKLFTGQYPVAWGKDKVQPDAFVTGTAEISEDLRTLTVSLQCFDRTTNKLVALGEKFRVANATSDLAESGESFLLRGAFDDGQTEASHAKNRDKAYQEAVKVQQQQSKHPGQDAGPPVALEVRYDHTKVPFEYKDGKAFIPEPREGQTVELGLKHDGSKNRYAIVLKVNGENTLEKERVPDLACHKWVLDPGYGPWAIRGYQVGDTLEKFRVASVAESKMREIYYGHDVGTITMTVFRERKDKEKLDLNGEYEDVLKKLPRLPDQPKNHGALVQQLLEANRGWGPGRSLIVEGQKEVSKVETVTFVPNPDPIMCLTIVYRR
jgi:hypothetical protein